MHATAQLQMFSWNHYYWIDAICINQDDLAERAEQGRLMGQIYANIEMVVVWLGRDLPELPAFN